LAERGADLVLVARRRDRLEALKAELTDRYGSTVEVIDADLAEPGAAIRLLAEVKSRGLTIGTLVNNAGFATHGWFAEADPEQLDREVAVDVAAVVSLSRAFFPLLLEQAARRPLSAALLNVASVAAFQPVPRMAVYAASKAFVLTFTKALWYEARPHGLKVTALCPGPIDSEFFDVAGSRDMAFGSFQSPAQVAHAGLAALDKRVTPPSAISGFGNAAKAFATRFVPQETLVNSVGKLGAPKK
jgi:short-subunit dehydrogenase